MRKRWTVIAGIVAASCAVAALPATATVQRFSALPGTNGLLVSRCPFSHRAPDDPIVHPGMAGMSHSHDFFGNTTTNADSTVDTLLGGTTTCRIAGDTSAYWAPTLYANGVAVTPVSMLAYYTRASIVMPAALPLGLEIVAGGRDHVRFSCFASGMPLAPKLRPPSCPPQDFFAIAVHFPDCWNGSDLDSPDHRSHMAYSKLGVCPADHSVAVDRLTLWFLYPQGTSAATLTLDSGGIETAHADFFSAWDAVALEKLHTFCLVGQRVCYKEIYRILPRLHLAKNRL